MIRAVRMIYAVWLALTAVGTAFPGLRFWGVHLPAFLPLWAKIVFFLLAGSIWLFPSATAGVWTSRIPPLVRRVICSPISAVALGGAFILFRVSYGFLGDGMLRGREAQMAIIRPVEVLSASLATGMYHLLPPMFHATGQDAVAAASLLAGCLFIVVLWLFTRRLWDDPGDRRTARMLLVASTLTVLFFGYVESYALTYLAIAGFLLAAESYRRGKGSYFTCLAFIIPAIASHLLAVVLLPSLFALSITPAKGRRWRLLAFGLIAFGAGAWGYWALHASQFARETPAGSILISLLPRAPAYYSFISPAHLLDFANLLLLVCPGVLIAIPLLRLTVTPARRGDSRLFWLLAVVLPLGIPLFLDPKLGMARDWDLFSLGLVPLVVWAAIRLTDNRSRLPGRLLAFPILASATTLAMFVGINANTNTSIARFEQLLELDPARGGYGHEILATWYHNRDQFQEEIIQWRKALKCVEHRRYWTGLSAAYVRAGDIANGFLAARRGYILDTTYAYSAYYLGVTYEELALPDSALIYYARAVRLAPRDLSLRYDLALALFQAGQLPDGIAHLDTLIRLAPDSLGYQNALAAMLIESNRFDEASSLVRAILQRNPQDFQAQVNLAMLYHKTGRDDLALAEIGALLRRSNLSLAQRSTLGEFEQRIRLAGAGQNP